MRQPMNHFFILPKSFDPLEFLSNPMDADVARYLISTIVRKLAYRIVDPWKWVRLHSDILHRVMGRRYAAIIRDLEKGVIETAPYYAGVKAKGYRLAKSYLSDRHIRRPATDPCLIDRIERERAKQSEQEKRESWKPIHSVLRLEQQHVTITEGAENVLDQLPSHTRLCQDVLVGNLRRRRLPFTVCSTGRVFNAVTGLKRELRNHLRIDDRQLGSLDIRASQPSLLALALGQGRTDTGHPLTYMSNTLLPRERGKIDCDEYVNLALSGGLYEHLMSLTGMDRAIVKERFIIDVLAKKGWYKSEVERVFREEFPDVHAVIRHINRDDHGTLIRFLQRMESWLVIEKVSPRLVGRTPFVTLHDAIFAPQETLDEVDNAFQQTFAEIGFSLRLKREAA
jgi:hypothetical protein